MVQQEKRSSNAASRDAELVEARKWEDEARAAREAGDWGRTIVCYRKALQLAPFASDLRDAFEHALEQQIREKLRREKAGKASARNAAAVLDDDDEDDAPAKAPARTARRAPKDEGWGFSLPRQKTMLAAACLAAVLTMGGLFATAMTAGWLRDRIATSDSSELAEAAPAPVAPALQSKLDNAAAQLKAGRRDDAIKTFRDAAKAFPEGTDAVNPLLSEALAESGAASLKLRRYDSAIKALQEAAELQPGKSLHWVNYGRALREYARSSTVTSATRKKEFLTKAESAFTRALSLEPADSGALYGLAQVYDARNNREKATETYEKLVALAPETMEGKLAKTNLAQLKKR